MTYNCCKCKRREQVRVPLTFDFNQLSGTGSFEDPFVNSGPGALVALFDQSQAAMYPLENLLLSDVFPNAPPIPLSSKSILTTKEGNLLYSTLDEPSSVNPSDILVVKLPTNGQTGQTGASEQGRIVIMMQNTAAEHLYNGAIGGRNDTSTLQTDVVTENNAVETQGFASIIFPRTVDGPIIAHFATKTGGGSNLFQASGKNYTAKIAAIMNPQYRWSLKQ